jgi:MFS family permease
LPLPPDELLRDPSYRRLWLSVLLSSFGSQVTLLALQLTAVGLLQASALEMGILAAVQILPFVLFSLPGGVWLDRVHKLPVYRRGEVLMAAVVASVPLAWWAGLLSIHWLMVVAFVAGTVATMSVSAGQIVLTQVVPRDRLVAAHARQSLATSGAEVAGPGFAGALVGAVGGPLAMLVESVMLLCSSALLRNLRTGERLPRHRRGDFRADLMDGLRFVRRQRLLVALALCIGVWLLCFNAAGVVQILYASRELGLSEQAIGLCYAGLGAGTVVGGAASGRLSARIGPGPSVALGLMVGSTGWLLAALPLSGAWAVAAFAAQRGVRGIGGVLLLVNFMALRQAVTPNPLMGRVTATMRWLALLPAGPGALLGGWVGEAMGLKAVLLMAGGLSLVAAAMAARMPILRQLRALPKLELSLETPA